MRGVLPPSTPRIAIVIAFLALLVAPPFVSSFLLALLTQAVIYAVLAMSLDIILGYTGLASLGHAAYLGLGAYSVGILATRHGAGFWVTLAVGILLATVVAAIFGLVALRATGVYFLMITLALGMVVWGLAHRWVSMTQGDNGISSVPRPDLGLPWSFTQGISFYYLAAAGFLIALLLLQTIVRSPFGHTLVGIRESESRMRALGYHVWLHKYIGFVIAGGVGGFAGVLWAYYNGFVSPADLELRHDRVRARGYRGGLETVDERRASHGQEGDRLGPDDAGAGRDRGARVGVGSKGADQGRLPRADDGRRRPDRQGHGQRPDDVAGRER
ncbi:MAG: branched-chain amino acid ABC transporter permease [Candidatus Rokuibacteriota bacterium]|nr:MAG: branched-chain amino acid ABC transporter permease [Candidatus Rokubacteria bacterium]